MFSLISAPGDAKLASRIQDDVRKALTEAPAAQILIAVLSPGAENDLSLQQALVNALDRGHYIIPVLAAPTPLPKWIDHLTPVDFSEQYDLPGLLARIAAEAAAARERRLPLKVRTPAVRASNRLVGLALLVLVLGMFILSLLALGGGIIGFPQNENATIDAEVIATRDAYLEQNLPHSTQDALNFPSTVLAAPRAQRPLLEATATARAASGE